MVSRRRFIRISAAAAGLTILPFGRFAKADASLVVWRGTLLGAVATMQIHHEDRDEAQRLVSLANTEARRLERLFSLYLEDSALVELNRSSILVAPATELVDLLTISRRYAELTKGMFDPTVQPLWDLYANHFSQAIADPAGPPRSAVRAALTHVGCDRLTISRDRIVMPRGTAVTLNGIAQGYVTDKIVDLLRSRGVVHSLVDMGETRAIGSRPDGQPWEVGIADPDLPSRTEAIMPIIDRAVSTSGAYGFRFDPQRPLQPSLRSCDRRLCLSVPRGDDRFQECDRRRRFIHGVQLHDQASDPVGVAARRYRACSYHRYDRSDF